MKSSGGCERHPASIVFDFNLGLIEDIKKNVIIPYFKDMF